jgi:hypothetical protein
VNVFAYLPVGLISVCHGFGSAHHSIGLQQYVGRYRHALKSIKEMFQ